MRAIRAEARRLRFRRFEQKLLQKIGERPIRYGCRPDGINILRCQQAPPPSSHVYAQKQKPCLSASDMDGVPAGCSYMQLFTDAGYRSRFRCGMARFSGMAELPFPRHCSLHGFSTLCAGPVFLPAYSEFSIKVWTICWRCGMMVLDSGINGYAGAGRSLPWCWRFSAVMRTWCKCNNK